MLIQVAQIDEEGYFLEPIILEEGEVLTEKVQTGQETYTDEEGVEHSYPIYEDRPRQDIIYEPVPEGLYRPKWTGSEWVEGLSAEEIEELTRPQPVPLTPDQLKIQELEHLNIDTMIALTSVFEENLALKSKNESLEQGQIETMLALTDVYEQLLLLGGGS